MSKCMSCKSNIIDGEDYVEIKGKIFCCMDCARDYLSENPGDAIDHYIDDFAEYREGDFESPYV